MPDKQVTHKTVAVKIETYDELLTIAKEVEADKGVPIYMPTLIQVLIDRWKATGRGKK
jgi:hypothetical protein